MESLVQAGVLISRQGRGTFTAPRRVEAPLAGPAGFTETMRHLGRESSTEVLWTEVEPASDVVAEHLGLAEGDSVVAFERLRKVDDVPAMLERCHLPELLFPAFPTASLTGSLYELLERRYGLRPATGVETIYSVNADDRLAYTLDAVVGSALLATVRVTHTDANVPMEYTVRYARGDVCSFRVNLDEDSKLTGRDGAVNVLALGRRHGAGSGAV